LEKNLEEFLLSGNLERKQEVDVDFIKSKIISTKQQILEYLI
jgi:hypothetical protein